MLVGYDTADDAGVFRIDAEHALVQTVDFFTPVVDDPSLFGAIAAANSLSDVYAMGAKPLTALAIACFPEKGMDLEILTRIMSGGVEKLREAEVVLLGGHTVADPEIKFGYSITGMVHPDRIMTNAGARPGDALVLTKPLGIGILTSGIKFNRTSAEGADRAIAVMTTLNRAAAEVMRKFDCHAATDITGFGLLGHAYEMAEASRAALRFQSARVPFIQEAYRLAEARVLPRTIGTTWQMIESKTSVAPSVPEPLKHVMLDPQTSGGLLIAVGDKEMGALLEEMARSRVEACYVGRVEEYTGPRIIVD